MFKEQFVFQKSEVESKSQIFCVSLHETKNYKMF
jgi:hypothetical protein